MSSRHGARSAHALRRVAVVVPARDEEELLPACLDSVEVAFGSSLTISNEVKGRLGIALERGRALLLAHPYPLPES